MKTSSEKTPGKKALESPKRKPVMQQLFFQGYSCMDLKPLVGLLKQLVKGHLGPHPTITEVAMGTEPETPERPTKSHFAPEEKQCRQS